MIKKIKIQYVLKKLLFKAIIVFTNIYFESYCKIPAQSNKSVLQSFYHEIHLNVKGILNQNKQIKTKYRSGFIQPARIDPGQCLKRNHHRTRKKQKIKTYLHFFGGDVNIYIYLLPLMSLFVTYFGYRPPHLPQWRHFWMVPYLFLQFQKWTAYSHSSVAIITIFLGSICFLLFLYFLPKSILLLKVTKGKVLLQFLYLVKKEQIQFYHMKTDFCAWLISIGKYHFAQKLHWFRYKATHNDEKCNRICIQSPSMKPTLTRWGGLCN